MEIRIFQWNARSLIANGQEFKKFIVDFKLIDIFCIQETWLIPKLNFKVPGYIIIRKDRKEGRGGGVCIGIKENIVFSEITIVSELEIVGVQINVEDGVISVMNMYNPCKDLDKEEIVNIIDHMRGGKIICGDFNSHNTLWGSKINDRNGRVIEEIIEDLNLVVLNSGEGTRYDVNTGKSSALDLSIVSAQLGVRVEWKMLIDEEMGSDHFPIILTIDGKTKIDEQVQEERWDYKKANWEKFQIICNNNIEENIIHNDVNIFNERIIKAIMQAAKGAIPMRKTKKGAKPAVPWWNEECSRLIKERKACLRKVKKTMLADDLIKFKKAKAMAQRVIRNRKKEYWQDYCSKISYDSSVKDVWNKIKAMAGKGEGNKSFPLKQDGIIITDDEKKASMLGLAFAKVGQDENYNKEFLDKRGPFCINNSVILEDREDVKTKINVPFSIGEVKAAIEKGRNSSPGEDKISNIMYKMLPDRSLEILLKLYNKVWELGVLPKEWKNAVIIPISKTGKDPGEVGSYRPIALTATICKIMERMVCERMWYFLESKKLLSDYQSGFRKNRSTTDQLVRLSTEVKEALSENEVVGAVFIDIEKAYDMVWKEGLIYKIASLGIKGRILWWIREFLKERGFKVKIKGKFSERFEMQNGTPQGSVVSPLLFNIMINDLAEDILVGSKVSVGLFADDGVIYKRNKHIEIVRRELQEALNNLEKWSNKWGFKISVTKTEVLLFSRRRREQGKLNLLYQDKMLKEVEEFKYLGVWFDKKLTWGKQINTIIDKCKGRMNILRSISGTSWGANKTCMMMIYRGLIRSVIDYGSQILVGSCKSKMVKLDNLQAKAIRVCIGAMKSAPINAMQVLVNEMPLELRRKWLSIKYWIKANSMHPEFPPRKSMEDRWINHYKKERWETNGGTLGYWMQKWIKELGMEKIKLVKNVNINVFPEWMMEKPNCCIKLSEQVKKGGEKMELKRKSQAFVEEKSMEALCIYTDGSKDPKTGRVAIAYYIPELDICKIARISDHLSVFVAEMVAILFAIVKIAEIKPKKAVIFSDSLSGLIALKGEFSDRRDIVVEIMQQYKECTIMGIEVILVWIPGHSGILGNEMVDLAAKNGLKREEIDVVIPLGSQEMGGYVKKMIVKEWQKRWDESIKGRFYYNIQKEVSNSWVNKELGRKEERALDRLRIGHSSLNEHLLRLGKHEDGKCEKCKVAETVEHYLLKCEKYEEQRRKMERRLREMEVYEINIKNLLGKGKEEGRLNRERILIKYIKETGKEGKL